MPDITINNIVFHYEVPIQKQFKAFGYEFIANPSLTMDHPVEFWQAQLAFRGFSPRGTNTTALKERLRNADTAYMDPKVRECFNKLIKDQDGNKKRRAEDVLKNNRVAPAARPAPAAAAAAAAQHLQKERVVDERMASRDPDRFLRDAFIDGAGNDAGYLPIQLRGLIPADRSHLHQAAEHLGLYHETTVTEVMIVGSGMNDLGRAMVERLNSAVGWPAQLHVPDVESSSDEDEDEDEDESDTGDWDITGDWELQCPRMGACFGGKASPHTLSIYSTDHDNFCETYGRFDLGEYEGVFRFTKPGIGQHSQKRADVFQLPVGDAPSEGDPIRSYCWRGKEMAENIIQLGEDRTLYTMKFSHHGSRVVGTWGTAHSDPGDVSFSGRKIRTHGRTDGMNIRSEWRNLNEAAYKKANRDRWR